MSVPVKEDERYRFKKKTPRVRNRHLSLTNKRTNSSKYDPIPDEIICSTYNYVVFC